MLHNSQKCRWIIYRRKLKIFCVHAYILKNAISEIPPQTKTSYNYQGVRVLGFREKVHAWLYVKFQEGGLRDSNCCDVTSVILQSIVYPKQSAIMCNVRLSQSDIFQTAFRT